MSLERFDPRIRVATRSSDSSLTERQRIVRQRPEILGEIHAVAASKRGTHLITAVDRLVLLSGEFQRIALSATVRPLARIAAWVGGFWMERGSDDQPAYGRRSMVIVESRQPKRYDISVRLPPSLAALSGEERAGDALWPALAGDLRDRIGEARSTLVFCGCGGATPAATPASAEVPRLGEPSHPARRSLVGSLYRLRAGIAARRIRTGKD